MVRFIGYFLNPKNFRYFVSVVEKFMVIKGVWKKDLRDSTMRREINHGVCG